MKFGSWLVATALLFAAAGAAPADDDAAFGEKVHAWLLAHPEVLIEMTQALDAKQTAQKQSAVKSYTAQLFSDPRDPSVGPKNAKIVIALFQDYQCGHCKTEAVAAADKLLADYSDVRIVFKELPIFGPKSQSAARVAIAASHQGKYFPVFKALMADRSLDTAAINAVLKSAGVDVKRAHADADSQAITTQLLDNEKLAREVGVEGTPTFVVGEHVIIGADMEEIEKAISELRHQKK